MITATNPKGVHVPITACQIHLESVLWTSSSNLEFYPRVFRHTKDDVQQAIVYTGRVAGEYIEVLQDDSKDATVYFHLEDTDTEIDGGELRSQVAVVFSVNLNTLYPAEGAYASEHAEADVLAALEMSTFEPIRLIKGFAAFEPFTVRNERVSMYPFHAFKIICNVSYLPETC